MFRTLTAGFALLVTIAVSAIAQTPKDVRTIDGSGNNLTRDEWGKAGTSIPRQAPAAYPGDGSGTSMVGFPTYVDRKNPRYISNHMCVQDGSLPNGGRMSDMVWQWGQFIDHDLSLTPNSDEDPGEFGGDATMFVPQPDLHGMVMIPFTRSNYETGSGVAGQPRRQINLLTAWIDASMVYGSDDETADKLRTFSDGLLRTSADGLLLPTEFNSKSGLDEWLAGDVRVGEQIGLTAMHTLFVREHNRLAKLIKQRNRSWTDEQIYQLARKIVGAEVQIITYEEFLPALLGWHAPNKLGGWTYDENVDPRVTTEFATALYRMGHTMLSPNLAIVGENGESYPPVALRDAFFNFDYYKVNPDRIDFVLRGLVFQSAQEIDAKLVEDVRSFLFGMGGVGMDLASLNIQRGRDHGIPDYNTVREYYGLARVQDFSEISKDPQVQADLQEMYGSVDNIDLWVGALCEDHLRGNCNVGSLLATAIRDQFERLREGDRFFWTRDNDLKTGTVRRIINLYGVRLSDIIKWNTNIRRIPNDVFRVYGR